MVPQGGITSSISPYTPFIYWLMRSRYTHTYTLIDTHVHGKVVSSDRLTVSAPLPKLWTTAYITM